MNPLESLMLADASGPAEESWGIEISVGMRSGIGGPVGMGMHNQVSNVMAMDASTSRRASTSSITEEVRPAASPTVSESGKQFQQSHWPRPHRSGAPQRSAAPQSFSSTANHSPAAHLHGRAPPRVVNANKTAHNAIDSKTARSYAPSSRRRKTQPGPAVSTSRNSLGTIDPNADQISRRNSSATASVSHGHAELRRSATAPHPSSDVSANEPFPTDIPAGLFSKPDSLTREQAQRLLASPAFLSMLEKLTGAPIDLAAAAKRAREGDENDASSSSGDKKAKHTHSRKGSVDSPVAEANTSSAFVCWNCGRSKSAVWRTKVMEDGKSVRVCNACGLYWNKMGAMRPPTLWGDVDDDPKDRPRKDKKAMAARQSSATTPMPTSEPDIPAVRMDKPVTRSTDGFKRTLSSVVEQDAKRIAASRPKMPMPKSALQQSTKPVPVSSPPRGSASATKSLRQDSAATAASSPATRSGAWGSVPRTSQDSDLPGRSAVLNSDSFHTDPVQPSPIAPSRVQAGSRVPSASGATMQSLDMPLSDDGTVEDPVQTASVSRNDWRQDLSALFDVEGFAMPPNTVTQSQPVHNRKAHVESPRRTSARLRRNANAASSTSAITAHNATDPSTEEDDVLSQLFNRTSSVGMSSPNLPFDFSSLPPSSPPACLGSDLPHSALLLSSPDESPLGYSPLDQKATPGKSRLRHSMSASAIDSKQTVNMGETTLDLDDIQRMLNNIGANHGDSKHPSPAVVSSHGSTPAQDYDMLQELFGKMSDGVEGNISSTAETEGIMGGVSHAGHGEDLFAMLDGSSFA
ncbi:hypothetical protein IAU60_003902 [Kwoniella sp. DSM 27419]